MSQTSFKGSFASGQAETVTVWQSIGVPDGLTVVLAITLTESLNGSHGSVYWNRHGRDGNFAAKLEVGTTAFLYLVDPVDVYISGLETKGTIEVCIIKPE